VSTVAAILAWPAGGFSDFRVSALVISARVRARRGEPGYWSVLDEAAQAAKAAPVALSALPIAAARAEAAWLEGAVARRIGEETGPAEEPGLAESHWFAGELEVWRHRAGLDCGDPAGLPEPYRLEITGDAAGAARWWQERGCSYEAALALAGSGDRAALRRALDMLRGLGAHPAAAAVARRLRALGEHGVPRGPRPATAANPAGLTSRETEVLRLMAAGLTNAEIAARLVLSDRTVAHHVSAIFRKLGARTRGEAGEQAARLGLTGPRSPAARAGRLPSSPPNRPGREGLVTQVRAASAALGPLAEPTRKVGKRWIALIALANLGLCLGYLVPLGVLLPNQVQAIAGSAHKVAAMGLVTGIGAAVAMISNPVAGALSDRTTGRFGRRHPWTVCGALAGAAALVLLAGQHTIGGSSSAGAWRRPA